jgi:hypothetical protein
MNLDKLTKSISVFPPLSKEESLLGINETATKLWNVIGKNDIGEIEKRLANIIIGAYVATNA